MIAYQQTITECFWERQKSKFEMLKITNTWCGGYNERDRQRQTDRQTEIETARRQSQRDRETVRDRDRHRERVVWGGIWKMGREKRRSVETEKRHSSFLFQMVSTQQSPWLFPLHNLRTCSKQTNKVITFTRRRLVFSRLQSRNFDFNLDCNSVYHSFRRTPRGEVTGLPPLT